LDGFRHFFEFVGRSQFRFYQERDLGLDLYHNGILGVALFVLGVASAVVFLLAIFHVITEKRHVWRLLLGLGIVALLVGAGTSYAHFVQLPQIERQLIRDTAGPRPANDEQKAAIVALPLVLGAATLAGNTLGCLYMAAFWGSKLLARKKSHAGS